MFQIILVRNEEEFLIFTTEYLHVAKQYCEEMNSYLDKPGIYITRTAIEGA